MQKHTYKALIVGSAILAGIAVAGISAYFSNAEKAKNNMNAGNVTTEIVEHFDPPTPVPDGFNYAKKIQIKNTGKDDCYVRVYVSFSDSGIAETSGIQTTASGDYYSAVHAGVAEDIKDSHDTVLVNKETFLDHLPDKWVYIPTEDEGNSDADADILGGYFYYTDVLKANGGLTDPLLERVLTYFATAEDVKGYDIIVTQSAIQILDKDGNPFPGSDKWKQAWTEYMQ